MCAKNCMHNSSAAFTGNVFDSIAKTYSDDSLQEIREELRALYTSEEIDCIIYFSWVLLQLVFKSLLSQFFDPLGNVYLLIRTLISHPPT